MTKYFVRLYPGINVKWYISWDGGDLAYLANYIMCLSVNVEIHVLSSSSYLVAKLWKYIWTILITIWISAFFQNILLMNCFPWPQHVPQNRIAQVRVFPVVLWQVSQRGREKLGPQKSNCCPLFCLLQTSGPLWRNHAKRVSSQNLIERIYINIIY